MGIVDDLLANPGTYIGIDRDTQGRGEAAAKIVVTPLPGGAGVALDYETFSTNPERIRGHVEHAILGRGPTGGAVLVTAHSHADSVAVMSETSPGRFEMGESGPFPMAIRIEAPEPGRLVHAWAYGAPGDEPVERDVAELTLER